MYFIHTMYIQRLAIRGAIQWSRRVGVELILEQSALSGTAIIPHFFLEMCIFRYTIVPGPPVCSESSRIIRKLLYGSQNLYFVWRNHGTAFGAAGSDSARPSWRGGCLRADRQSKPSRSRPAVKNGPGKVDRSLDTPHGWRHTLGSASTSETAQLFPRPLTFFPQ